MSQIEARIAANSQSIRKICNEELAHFNQQLLIHELIRGSLVYLQEILLGFALPGSVNQSESIY